MTRARLGLGLAIIYLCAMPLAAREAAPDPSARNFTARACSWAGDLVNTTEPDDLERELFRDPSLLPPTLTAIGEALASSTCARRDDVAAYAAALAKANARRLSDAGAPWTRSDMAMLLAYQLVNPVRFAEKASFRKHVLPLIPAEMSPAFDAELRARQMRELNAVIGFGYDAADETESAWGLVPRSSASRRADLTKTRLSIADDYAGPIEASVFVLPSSFFAPADVERFLSAQRKATPERRLVVVSDEEMKNAVAEKVGRKYVEWIDSYDRPFTPWPRDPFTVARDEEGSVVLLTRPNVQPGREDDANIARQIAAGASDSLDAAFGHTRWAPSKVPFHNGQVLITPDVAWVSIHALEPGNLDHMGRRSIPRSQFDTMRGIDEYVATSRKTIADLEKLYGRRVRLVHPLPESGTLAARKKLVDVLFGGAGFDLDSLVTLVPNADGGWTAFVADLSLDDALIESTPDDEWARFRNAYGFAAAGDALRKAMRDAQHNAPAKKLDAFVDLVAKSLESDGMRVERLPLLLVPVPLLADTKTLTHRDFVIGWNNIVFERTGPDALRGHAFASLLESADRSVVERFAAEGVDLQLLPSLVRSVILNGGYRCASNNVRAVPRRAGL